MRMPIFSTVDSRNAMIDRLDIAVTENGVRVVSYCVMPNHLHVLVLTESEGDLSETLRNTLGAYAAWYKAKHGHEGHVFERRFRNVECATDRHIDEACRYIAMNPVRAGLAKTAFEYPWSSFLQIVGVVEPRSFLDADWSRERFSLLGAWPSEWVAFVHREDAPEDLTLFEDPRCVALMDDASPEALKRARTAGLSVRKIAKVVGCSHQTVIRRLRA
jgi:REP element-mobilizing transposase RayT